MYTTTGAVYIRELLMIHHKIEILDISFNDIGDDGIATITEVLHNSKVEVLNVYKCGITFTGARLLADSLSMNQTIKVLWLWSNPITLVGAHQILQSAVDNKVCYDVEIDEEYEEDEKTKKMMAILKERMENYTLPVVQHSYVDNSLNAKEKLVEVTHYML